MILKSQRPCEDFLTQPFGGHVRAHGAPTSDTDDRLLLGPPLLRQDVPGGDGGHRGGGQARQGPQERQSGRAQTGTEKESDDFSTSED